MKYLVLIFLLFASCGSEGEAGGLNLKDIGFSSYQKDGVREDFISCPADQIAISSGCDCDMANINAQYIDGNTAYCFCDGGYGVTVSIICASIQY